MAGPPKDIPASQLWLKLASAERPTKVVDFPRRDDQGRAVGQIRIRILTQEEQMTCATAAEEVAKAHIKDGRKGEIGYERLFTDALCIETLFRACRDADNPTAPAFPPPKQMRTILTTEECSALFLHYLTIQLELGPNALSLSEEECEAWIDRLVEGGSAFPFDLLSSEQKKVLVLYMAYQLRPSPKDKSSDGEQPDESTDEPKIELELPPNPAAE